MDKITLDDSETEDLQPPQLQQEEEGETEARGDRGAQPWYPYAAKHATSSEYEPGRSLAVTVVNL